MVSNIEAALSGALPGVKPGGAGPTAKLGGAEPKAKKDDHKKLKAGGRFVRMVEGIR
jgi:hypothetical protein